MSVSKEDVLNAIAEMSVMEVVELIADMEEKFGVSAAAAVAVAPAAGAAGVRLHRALLRGHGRHLRLRAALHLPPRAGPAAGGAEGGVAR